MIQNPPEHVRKFCRVLTSDRQPNITCQENLTGPGFRALNDNKRIQTLEGVSFYRIKLIIVGQENLKGYNYQPPIVHYKMGKSGGVLLPVDNQSSKVRRFCDIPSEYPKEGIISFLAFF